MSALAIRRIALLLALAALGSACGGKALGNETSGQGIKAADRDRYNISEISVADRHQKPSFDGDELDGKHVSSADLVGHVSLVNFWASWCAPCRIEQPSLERLWKAYESRGVLFLGIDIRDTRVDARAHREEFGVTYPSVFNRDANIAFKFRMLFTPTTYILDRSGRVAAKITGPTEVDANVARILDRLLAEPA